MYSQWSKWGECSELYCGGGTKHRSKECLRLECKDRGDIDDSSPCNEQPCPVDGGTFYYVEIVQGALSRGGGKRADLSVPC